MRRARKDSESSGKHATVHCRKNYNLKRNKHTATRNVRLLMQREAEMLIGCQNITVRNITSPPSFFAQIQESCVQYSHTYTHTHRARTK